ncbi:unnamed protein product [Cyprideis torosa]|uniref:Uncharacterized protein n=1 Tax=Cyprideis torosa TaxID=163714 RepID=A0A7R8W9Q1_9CRUS|nr:unnamed protein product [Cyprideis torosa]CAG0884545.1 unnamed protein product [Cyprideis torosa]
MFALGRDPDVLHVTLWRDYEDPVKLPIVQPDYSERVPVNIPHEISFIAPQPCHQGVKILLAHGADCNAAYAEEKLTPLHITRTEETARLLLWHRAKVNFRSQKARTPLHHATADDLISVTKVLLIHGAKPNVADKEGKTPLHEAQSSEAARLLIEKKADVNAKDRNSMTPLFIAVSHDLHSVAEVLLNHEADPNITAKDWLSPLHEARSSETAELLIRHGANLNAKTRARETPLCTATKNGCHSVVRFLLSHGASPNIVSLSGMSPLHEVQSGETARLLLEHGAIIDGVDIEGRTPLFCAIIAKNREDVVRVLVAQKASLGMTVLSRKKFEKMIPAVIPYIEDLNEQDEDGNTLLHSCCQLGYEDAVKQLLKSGAAQDILNNNRETAQEVAIAKGHFHIASHFRQSTISNGRFEQEFEIMTDERHEDGILGKGGFGRVYKVKRRGTENVFAIKQIDFEKEESESMDRMLQELRAAMDLTSKVTVTHYSAWIEERQGNENELSDSSSSEEESPLFSIGRWAWKKIKRYTLYIQLEFVDMSLADFIHKRNNNEYYTNSHFPQLKSDDYSTAVRIFRDICHAVYFLHVRGYVHRDLKPGNVLVSFASGSVKSVKLADFGLAMKLRDSLGMIIKGGTRYYSPPILNDAAAQRATGLDYKKKLDVYALGIIWVDLLLPMTRAQWRKVNENIRSPQVRIPEELKKSMSQDDFDLLKRMLSHEPDARPTVEEVFYLRFLRIFRSPLPERGLTWFEDIIRAQSSSVGSLIRPLLGRICGLIYSRGGLTATPETIDFQQFLQRVLNVSEGSVQAGEDGTTRRRNGNLSAAAAVNLLGNIAPIFQETPSNRDEIDSIFREFRPFVTNFLGTIVGVLPNPPDENEI